MRGGSKGRGSDDAVVLQHKRGVCRVGRSTVLGFGDGDGDGELGGEAR